MNEPNATGACPEYRDALLDEAVGELSESACRELVAHCETCPECSNVRARLRSRGAGNP